MTEGQPSCAYEGCDRVPHKTSSDGHCIFHAKAEDKTVEDFRQALKKYLSKLKQAKDAVYDFVGFIFAGDINFMENFGLNVFERANFELATFEGEAVFQAATFKGEASFWAATFKGEASFLNVTFKGKTWFGTSMFTGYASFGGAIFEESTVFWSTTFEGDAWFWGATFEAGVSFEEATFEGEAFFQDAIFEGGVSFEHATFKGEASFLNATFKRDTLFDRAKFRESASISPKIVKVGISFSSATIENIVMSPLHLEEETQIDFTGARLRNTNIRREDVEGHIKQGKNEHHREARDIYMLLKNNFHTIGRYEDESWAFMQEKEMERRSFFHYRKEYKEQELGEKLKNRSIKDSLCCLFLAYVHSGVYADERMTEWSQSDGISTHMSRLDKLFCTAINLLGHPIKAIKSRFKSYCAFLELNRRKRMGKVSPRELFRVFWFYMKYPVKYAWSTFLKWLYGWGEWPWLILAWCVATIFIFSVLYCFIGDIASATNLPIVKSYGEKLFFSGITFTTLGFGGYSPMGWAKVLAFIESFLGIFSIALFVYSFARRTAGR